MIKVFYNSDKAVMFFVKPKPNKVYARVSGENIYFSHSKEKMLRPHHHDLLRHELEHIYQARRHGPIWFKVQYGFWMIILFFRYLSLYKAYYNNPFEIEARKKGSNEKLTAKELLIFINEGEL